MATSPKWNTDAARAASIVGTARNRSTKSSVRPAPPEAITGTRTASQTRPSSSRSKPPFTPSVSIEFTTTSPAPSETQRRIQSMASSPVSSRPPRANTRKPPSTRLTSADSTTHWSPYRCAARLIRSGSRIAPELTLTLSAPHLSTRSKSSRLSIPPPTVRGMKTFAAVCRRMSVNSARPSADAVMS